MPEIKKERIAILGGGVGAMSAAFELTSIPNWQERYEITVYQMGWRLGGKGASGRDQSYANRILEHGLHLWMGFYENAFRQIRDAYAEWNAKGYQPAPFWKNYTEAFVPRNYDVAMENMEKKWRPWVLLFPQSRWQPGQDIPGLDAPLDMWDLVLRMLGMMVVAFLGAKWQTGFRGWLLRVVGRILLWIAEHLGANPIVRWTVRFLGSRVGGPWQLPVLHLLGVSEHRARAKARPKHHETVLNLLEQFAAWFESDRKSKSKRADDARRLSVMLDVGVAVVRGVLEDDVLTRGYDFLDDQDFLQWLGRHGCQEPDNPITRFFYDACFAYRRGRDEYHPDLPAQERMGLSMGAGAVLYGLLRLVGTYKGGIMNVMNAGMGDTIFSPFYLVLKNRGVRFKFFHRVTRLALTDDRRDIASIDIAVQAATNQGEYDPLIVVNGVPSWPSEPLYGQLKNGDALKKHDLESYWGTLPPVDRLTLQRGQQFDKVILGISLGAVPYLCQELLAHNERWRAMVDRVETVKTQAFQMWMNRSEAQMGWNRPLPILTGFVEPHDTWCAMDHLIPRESWPAEAGIQQIAYFCNVMQECTAARCPVTCTPLHRAPDCPIAEAIDDPNFPAQQDGMVRHVAISFLNRDVRIVWPLSTNPNNPNEFDWNALICLHGSRGERAFDEQAWHANYEPTERYVQNIPGSTRHRLHPAESGFGNLFLAGDWTYTPINIGCVEAACISGKMAAWGVSGSPGFIYGPMGYPQPIDQIRYKEQPESSSAAKTA
ncbi:MAG TPA: NAD(P)-binding protein [Bryobacteraceae bacterium]|nr:NAD(P)-binding protein [Bryobacteraceae bacterium]